MVCYVFINFFLFNEHMANGWFDKSFCTRAMMEIVSVHISIKCTGIFMFLVRYPLNYHIDQKHWCLVLADHSTLKINWKMRENIEHITTISWAKLFNKKKFQFLIERIHVDVLCANLNRTRCYWNDNFFFIFFRNRLKCKWEMIAQILSIMCNRLSTTVECDVIAKLLWI